MSMISSILRYGLYVGKVLIFWVSGILTENLQRKSKLKAFPGGSCEEYSNQLLASFCRVKNTV